MTKFQSLFQEFEEALENFKEVLRQEKNEFVRDSAIKRYELVFERSWKATKEFLEDFRNARCASPQACFREAFQQGIIGYDEFWIEMAKWRNEAVHIYKEELAEALYAKLPQTLSYFQKLHDQLAQDAAQENK